MKQCKMQLLPEVIRLLSAVGPTFPHTEVTPVNNDSDENEDVDYSETLNPAYSNINDDLELDHENKY